MVNWEDIARITFFICVIVIPITIILLSDIIKDSKVNSFCQEHGLKSDYSEMKCYNVTTKDTINKYPIEFDGGIYNGKIYFVKEDGYEISR